MLKLIAESSVELLGSIEGLNMPLSEPQKRHVLQIADALITTEGRKDLSNLYRHIVGDPCPKSAAGFGENPVRKSDTSEIGIESDIVNSLPNSIHCRVITIRI